MNKDQITNITGGTKGYEYSKVTQRKKWVEYLEENEKKGKELTRLNNKNYLIGVTRQGTPNKS